MKDSVAFSVSLEGSDSNPGTQDAPFASLHRAQDAARAIKDRAVSILLRGGTHYLGRPLTFTPEDSRTEDGPLKIVACPGEVPVVSGAVRLDLEWTPFQDGIYEASVPETVLSMDQLFVNGRRKIRARFPSYDHEDPSREGKGVLPTGGQFGSPPEELEFYETEDHPMPFRDWKHPEEAVLFVRWFYGEQVFQLKGFDFETNRFLLGRGGWHWNTRLFSDGNFISFGRFHIENAFEALTDPGEWYFDKRAGKLYYIPEEGEDLSDALVEAPQLQQLIEFQGSQDTPVANISVEGLKITHSTTVYLEPWEAVSMGDWTIHRSGAVFMEGAEHCSVRNCFLTATGGNAVFMNEYNRENVVDGCTITDTGESAICLVGSNLKRLGDRRPFPDECLIRNNHLHHLGEYQTQVAGVFIACSQKITVNHCDIHDVPRAAVLIHDPTWGGHIIEHTKMHRTCQDSVDHGPFNSWGRTRHWCYNQAHGPDCPSHESGNVQEDALYVNVLRYNYLEDSGGNFGIDMDDGSCRYHHHHNVLVGCPIKFREGTENLAENNIIIDSALGTRCDSAYEHNTNRFVRNIMVCTRDMHIGPGYGISEDDFKRHFYHAMQCPLESPMLKEIDYNLFWSDLGQFKACVSPGDNGKRTTPLDQSTVYDLEAWREEGYDKHSLFADPLFVDPENGDYSLRPDSPAHALGFESFATNQFGLLPEFAAWQEDVQSLENEDRNRKG